VASEQVRELIAEKRRWIDTHPTLTLSARRCREIRSINVQLAALLDGERAATEGRSVRFAEAVKARTVLRARDHAWCLFPENVVKTFLLLENGAGPA
jgi:hypothetical protein